MHTRQVNNLSSHIYYFVPPKGATYDFGQVQSTFYNLIEDQVVISLTKVLSLTHKLEGIDGKNISDVELASTVLTALRSGFSGQYKFEAQKLTDGLLPAMIQGASVDTAAQNIIPEVRPHLVNSYKKFTDVVISGKGEEWSQKQDLFPPETRVGIFALFEMQGTPGNFSFGGCQYISGQSPDLYLYSDTPVVFHVSFDQIPLTYYFPSVLSDFQWKGTLVQTQSFYYEYDKKKVHLDSSQSIIAKRDQIEKLLKTLASRLKLNTKETDNLLLDGKKTLEDIKTGYVKISLPDESEIEKKLPLIIFPKPDHLYRIHFILSEGTVLEYLKQTLYPDELKVFPMERRGFTVVEVGAHL